jgi:ATP-dependent helicase/nuclease subunit B
VRGRLDRIDRHEQTGRWAIFDYKSSESAKTPANTHLRSGHWVDLQLPLYRRLGTTIGIPGDAELGYILLPKDTKKAGAVVADWTPAQLQAADATLFDAAQRILSGEFWPPTTEPASLYDEFAWLCQDRVFERELEELTV